MRLNRGQTHANTSRRYISLLHSSLLLDGVAGTAARFPHTPLMFGETFIWWCFTITFIVPWGMRNAESELACAVFLILHATLGRFWSTPTFSPALALLLIGFIATTLSLIADPDVDYWQMTRSAVPQLLFIVSFDLGRRCAERKNGRQYGSYLWWLLAAVAVHSTLAALGFSLANARISTFTESYDASSQLRVFGSLILFSLPLFLHALQRSEWILAITSAIVVLLSGSRGIILAAAIMFICFAWSGIGPKLNGKPRVARLLGKASLLILVFSLLGLGIFLFADRFVDSLGRADQPRLRELSDAFSIIVSDIRNLTIGIGYGVPYSFGWYNYSLIFPGDALRAFENSRFDVHNSFVAIMLRSGAAGVVIFIYCLLYWIRHIKWRGAFFVYIIIIGNTSHALTQTADSAFAMFVWGYLACLQYTRGSPRIEMRGNEAEATSKQS